MKILIKPSKKRGSTPVYSFDFASLKIRFFATLLDFFISFFLMLTLLRGYTGTWAQTNINVIYFMVGYYFFCTAAFSSTVGGVLLGIKVVDYRGHNMSFIQAFLRFLLLPLTILPLGVGFFMALTTPFKQTWHDTIARTFVIHVDEN